ncbi:unnamed protein product [Protopolystoma xenopodis]|uniref:Secreted protein n=1 Tax=Protopolystoma xenopodis TaxID=117903 RepID=A0A448WQA8_9PLAT|nr:unnamed protein product [Protopolystoma xenopodis]
MYECICVVRVWSWICALFTCFRPPQQTKSRPHCRQSGGPTGPGLSPSPAWASACEARQQMRRLPRKRPETRARGDEPTRRVKKQEDVARGQSAEQQYSLASSLLYPLRLLQALLLLIQLTKPGTFDHFSFR